MKKNMLFSITVLMSAPVLFGAEDVNISEIFCATMTPSEHERKVNTFDNMKQLGEVFNRVSGGLSLDPSPEVGANEAYVIEQHTSLFPHKMKLVDGKWSTKDRLENFRSLFLKGNEEKLAELDVAAKKILDWSGFYFAEMDGQMGLEFFTELGHSGADLVDIVNAYHFAKFLGNKNDVSKSDWQKFTETKDFKKVMPFKRKLEAIAKPMAFIAKPMAFGGLSADSEEMSISSALQDFRMKNISDFVSLLPNSDDTYVERESLFEDRLEGCKKKLQEAQGIVSDLGGLESTYDILLKIKLGGDVSAETKDNVNRANNIRREIGGSTAGFLFMLKQLMRAGSLSEEFYFKHKNSITELLNWASDMDKLNLETVIYKKEEAGA